VYVAVCVSKGPRTTAGVIYLAFAPIAPPVAGTVTGQGACARAGRAEGVAQARFWRFLVRFKARGAKSFRPEAGGQVRTVRAYLAALGGAGLLDSRRPHADRRNGRRGRERPFGTAERRARAASGAGRLVKKEGLRVASSGVVGRWHMEGSSNVAWWPAGFSGRRGCKVVEALNGSTIGSTEGCQSRRTKTQRPRWQPSAAVLTCRPVPFAAQARGAAPGLRCAAPHRPGRLPQAGGAGTCIQGRCLQ
jgi:hypothetical protein